MARKKYSIDSRIDYSVILPVFFLLLIGLVAVILQRQMTILEQLQK